MLPLTRCASCPAASSAPRWPVRLSMVFGCALRAPHGGIFVFPVVDHALLYVVALIVGSVVGAVILSLLKKEYVEE